MPHLPGTPLLATKFLLPHPRQSLVTRPRLVRLLDGALAHPLTLVSAPAGFGKTTLVAAWAQQQALPLAWLTLDPADNDAQRFLRYLLAALQTLARTPAAPDIGRDLRQALEGGQAPPLAAAAVLLLNDLAELPHDVLLVLDDFQHIEDSQVEAALEALVAHQPPHFHLLIATREDPPLPLARLRGQGRLLEVRAQDLRFSPQEAAAFLHDVMGLALTPQQLTDLDARLEGWVAGLQLAGLSLQKSEDPGALIAGLSSSHHFILTYLTEEVLRRQAADVQDFLLRTAILDRLSGPLCDAVCGRTDSDALLAALCAGNAFVLPLDDGHTWYRCHQLFRELLLGQLQRTHGEIVPQLHRRAAAWYAAHNLGAEAVDHALASGDHTYAVALLEEHARPLVLEGYAQTVAGWLQRLPPAMRAAGPHTNVAFAWSLLLRGQLGEIDDYLQNAETAMAALPMASAIPHAEPAQQGGMTSEARQGIQAEILALRAGLISLRGDPQRACTVAQEAVALAPAGNTYVQGATRFCLATALNYAGRTGAAIAAYQAAIPLCRAAGNTAAALLGVANLSLLTFERGELHAAAAVCREVIARAEAAGARRSPMLAPVYGALAHVLYEWNDLDPALAHAQTALALGRRSGHAAAVAYGSVVLSRILAARGDPAGAEQMLAAAEQMRGRTMPAWVAPYIVAQRVQLALLGGDEAAAAAALAASGVSGAAPTNHTLEIIHLAHLRLHLWRLERRRSGGSQPAVQEAQAAAELGGRIFTSAEAGERLGRMIEALAMRALVYAGMAGYRTQAYADLQRGLELAASSGYLRLFVGLGASMARLLAAFDSPPALEDYVRRIRQALPAAPGEATHEAQGLVEPLSTRELEVLQLMAAGLTYGEVAARLIVSVNTVRFHVKSIYGKLGVDNRTAALDAARSRHLL